MVGRGIGNRNLYEMLPAAASVGRHVTGLLKEEGDHVIVIKLHQPGWTAANSSANALCTTRMHKPVCW